MKYYLVKFPDIKKYLNEDWFLKESYFCAGNDVWFIPEKYYEN